MSSAARERNHSQQAPLRLGQYARLKSPCLDRDLTGAGDRTIQTDVAVIGAGTPVL